MKTTHQTPTPVGPTCDRPSDPTRYSGGRSQRGPARFTEPLAAIACGKLAPEFFSRLVKSLAVAFWLVNVAVLQAATVSINSYEPKAVTLGGAWVTVEVEASNVVIDFINNDEPDWITLTLTGGTIDGGSPRQGVCGNYSVPFAFFVYDITADLVITVTGGNSDTKTIPLGKITGLNLRMAQDINLPSIAEANYDQDVYIRASLNVDPLPLPLNYESIGWSYADPIAGSSWAKYTTHAPGRPMVYATLGCQSVNRDFWMVKLTLKEINLSGAGFREIKMDPPLADPAITIYSKPHWDTDRGTGREAYPILMQINQVLKATPKFIKEPSDYPNSVKIKATGGYEMDEQQTSCAASIFTGLESSANVAVDISVGNEKPSLTWKFTVGQSAATDAGISVLDIYRAVDGTATDYITVVDIACKNGGTLAPAIISGIWGQFSGLGVTKYDGIQLLYYPYGSDTPDWWTKKELIANNGGKCQAFCELFTGALNIHGIVSYNVTMTRPGFVGFMTSATPPQQSLGSFVGLGLVFKDGLAGQGNLVSPRNFLNHLAVRIPFSGGYGKIYDPSYGGTPYSSYETWEDGLLDSIAIANMQPPNDLRFFPNRPGVADTSVNILPVVGSPPPSLP